MIRNVVVGSCMFLALVAILKGYAWLAAFLPVLSVLFLLLSIEPRDEPDEPDNGVING